MVVRGTQEQGASDPMSWAEIAYSILAPFLVGWIIGTIQYKRTVSRWREEDRQRAVRMGLRIKT